MIGKNSHMKSLLAFLLLACFSCSCSSEENPSRTDENLVQNLSTGQWAISSFVENGLERGGDFAGVDFSFFPNGQIEAYRGTQLLGQGSWSSGNAVRRIEVRISFPSGSPFVDLNADWYQVFIRLNRIQLRNTRIDSDDFLILQRR
ncbi:hypothetical protein Ataiwa_23730 [Algoriphagus taiwanensis]|uniref:Lipocalin-like domain-containing protein n=2 Tax=Algoriphagus taiwanensis TaxID=1445656 RepID=A0ABQ6Q1T9_9BACT|nr:hypothetical protein Ataiwa_23730 [Algoriphagus taiwanensis]